MKEIQGDTYKGREESSYKIFQRFTKFYDNGKCDASGIIGKECYKLWVKSRKYPPKSPHEAFRRAVTAHIRGNDGRRPFPEAAERSLLKELRKKKQWDAFSGTEHLVGIKGFTSLGHHEKIRKGLNPQINKRKLAAMKKREQTLNTKERTRKLSAYQPYRQPSKRLKTQAARPKTVSAVHPMRNTYCSLYPVKKHQEVLIPEKKPKMYKSEFEVKAEDIYGSITGPAYAYPNLLVQDPILGEGCVHNMPFCTECYDPITQQDPFTLDCSLDDLLGEFDLADSSRSILNY